MVARVWKGLVRAAQVDEYVAYVNRTGIVGFRATPGNRGAMVLHRSLGETAEVIVVSLWESRQSIEGFAGHDISRARFYPEDDEFLLERDFFVSHYEVGGISDAPGAAQMFGAR